MSEMLGRGGKTAAAASASGMSRNTVIKAEIEAREGVEPSDRLRAPGGGYKSLIDTLPGMLEALDELVHPGTRGIPMSRPRWTSKSSTKLAKDLVGQGFEVSSRMLDPDVMRRITNNRDLPAGTPTIAAQPVGQLHANRSVLYEHKSGGTPHKGARITIRSAYQLPQLATGAASRCPDLETTHQPPGIACFKVRPQKL